MTFETENTLGGVSGNGAPPSEPLTPVAKVLRQSPDPGASLGLSRLAVGAVVIAGAQAAYSLAGLLINLDAHPDPVLALAAWALLALTMVTGSAMVLTVGQRLPTWAYIVILVAAAGAALMDIAAVWSSGNLGAFASAAVSAGFSLLILVTVRPPHELVIAGSVLAVGLVASVLMTTPLTPSGIPTQLAAVGTAAFPLIVGTYIVRRFRHLLQVELDRVLVQSTVGSPRFAVGMLASEELARLDLAAERLLESVADESTPLPLPAQASQAAASLATELRLHLIEGRRETWLYHAISESETLGRMVSVSDKGSLAGLMNPRQRDGLLSAVWLLVNNSGTAAPHAISVEVGPAKGTVRTEQGHRLVVPIRITVPDVARKRIDSAAWGAIAAVGQYEYSADKSGVRVMVDCLVDNPADR